MDINATLLAAELHIKEFRRMMKEIEAEGFRIHVNPDDTLYAAKVISQEIEEYGTKPTPQMRTNHAAN